MTSPYYYHPKAKIDMKQAVTIIASELWGVTVDSMRMESISTRSQMARDFAIWYMHRHMKMALWKSGQLFGIGYADARKAVMRIDNDILEGGSHGKIMERALKILNN